MFVTTLPKSGTYFLGAILKELGFEDTEIHAGPSLTDYRSKTREQSLHDHLRFQVHLPYGVQVFLTLPGQYLLGHINPDLIRAKF